MVENVKILLGEAAESFTDAQISLCLRNAKLEIKAYCNLEELDEELEACAERIAIIKLTKLNNDGLASVSYSGISETYVDGYPADLVSVLNRKRTIKLL